MATSTQRIADASVEEFSERVLGSALGAIEILSMYLGDRLGWYGALADGGPATAEELVRRAGGDERYAREWLEQQSVIGVLTVDETDEGSRFTLPPGAATVLTDPDSLSFLAPLARVLGGSAIQLPKLVEAYRSGGGVGWAEFGADAREAQADMNRPWFEKELPPALARVEEIDRVLARPGARIADIGCGGGWSTIALARAYPGATLDGYDIDRPSIELARANLSRTEVEDRVKFHLGDGAELVEGSYDAVFAFECIHDMPQPVEVLAAARRALKRDGAAIVMDEAVGERFAAPGDDMERLMYGYSLLLCLPDGRSHEPSVGTGTVMRPDTLRRYAREAGFRDISVLPTGEFGFWRFYRLHH